MIIAAFEAILEDIIHHLIKPNNQLVTVLEMRLPSGARGFESLRLRVNTAVGSKDPAAVFIFNPLFNPLFGAVLFMPCVNKLTFNVNLLLTNINLLL